MKYFEVEIEVRFDETDEMGIVHHKNYFSWFEIGRFRLLKAVGLDYGYLRQNEIGVVVLDAHCEYKLSAKFGDTLIIQLYLKILKRTMLEFKYIVRRKVDYALLAEGSTSHVILKHKKITMTIPVDIKEKIVNFINGYGWDKIDDEGNGRKS